MRWEETAFSALGRRSAALLRAMEIAAQRCRCFKGFPVAGERLLETLGFQMLANVKEMEYLAGVGGFFVAENHKFEIKFHGAAKVGDVASFAHVKGGGQAVEAVCEPLEQLLDFVGRIDFLIGFGHEIGRLKRGKTKRKFLPTYSVQNYIFSCIYVIETRKIGKIIDVFWEARE